MHQIGQKSKNAKGDKFTVSPPTLLSRIPEKPKCEYFAVINISTKDRNLLSASHSSHFSPFIRSDNLFFFSFYHLFPHACIKVRVIVNHWVFLCTTLSLSLSHDWVESMQIRTIQCTRMCTVHIIAIIIAIHKIFLYEKLIHKS